MNEVYEHFSTQISSSQRSRLPHPPPQGFPPSKVLTPNALNLHTNQPHISLPSTTSFSLVRSAKAPVSAPFWLCLLAIPSRKRTYLASAPALSAHVVPRRLSQKTVYVEKLYYQHHKPHHQQLLPQIRKKNRFHLNISSTAPKKEE